jgi:hypothetical protein
VLHAAIGVHRLVGMMPALAALLLSVTQAAPAGGAAQPVIRQSDPGPGPALVRLDAPERLAELCRSLEPAERVRSSGDPVEQGEAGARHAAAREAALRERYEVLVPAAALAFAPYDGVERRLSLQEPVQLPLADGAVRLWPTEERALPVGAEPAAARRVVEARRKGTLALALVFDLPEDATCGTGARGTTHSIPIEPVSWRWLDGDAVVVGGGVAADRPTVSVADGARPEVSVGDPIAGPSEAKRALLARASDLEGCYAEALKRDPTIDGVLVAEFGGARASIAADSVGDAELAGCVQRVVAALASGRDGRAAVPIRFELAPPAQAAKGR